MFLSRFMFLDESSVYNRAHYAAKGWFSLNIVPSVKKGLEKGQRYSILLVYTLEGYVACGIVQKFYDSERFLEFLTMEVLLFYIFDKTIIVLNNYSIYRDEII